MTPGLPTEEDEARLRKLIEHCSVSREERRAACEKLRDWYKNGTSSGDRAKYNKLKSHIRTVSSFVFSPGTTRFSVHLPKSVRDQWMNAASIARDEFRQFWEDSESDLLIKTNLPWSLVYGCIIIKAQPHPVDGFQNGAIQPWDFGVSREDVLDINQQDALCHWYTLSVPQVQRWIGTDPKLQGLVDAAERDARAGNGGSVRTKLVLSSISGVFPGGTISGGFPGSTEGDQPPFAQVIEPTVEFVDLWERRLFTRKGRLGPEQFEDWLVTTYLAKSMEPFVQRRNPDFPNTRLNMREVLPAELPFVALRPDPEPDYFWGTSELENLTSTQDWLEDHLADIKKTVRRQLRPPKVFFGGADAEEAQRELDTDDGIYVTSDPSTRMDKIQVQLAPEAMKLTDTILNIFADQGGIPMSISEPANMPGGVRATGHFSMAAGIGAGRLRDTALVIEKPLGALASLDFHAMQRTSTDVYRKDDGQPFLLSQIPYMVSLSVDGHSSSPIFAEQTQSKAMLMQKAGAIGLDDFVDLIAPPHADELRAKAKDIAKNKADMAQTMIQIQEKKAEKTGSKK